MDSFEYMAVDQFTCTHKLISGSIEGVADVWIRRQQFPSQLLCSLAFKQNMRNSFIRMAAVSAHRRMLGVEPVQMKIQFCMSCSQLEDGTLVLSVQ